MRRAAVAVLLTALLAAGCVTMGRDFPADPVKAIVNGSTTKEEIQRDFGRPYQTGIEDGKETWTFYIIRYRGAEKTTSKELHLTFGGGGIVESYSFTTTEPPR